MARLDDIDLDIKNAVLRANATDREEIARILRYLYRLSEKLKWWQTKLDRGNLTDEERVAYEGLFTEIEKIRKELAEKAGKETATESSDGLMSAADKKKLDELEVGARNLLLNSAKRVPGWYASATGTITPNQTVPEWGCTDAYRVQGNPGTSALFAIIGGDMANGENTSVAGQKYTTSVYIKNNSVNKMHIRTNPEGTPAYFTIEANETKRAVINSTGNGSYYLQIQFITKDYNSSFDFYYWHPQVEHGTLVTDWTPAPEDYSSDTGEVGVSQYRTANVRSDGVGGFIRKVGRLVHVSFSATLNVNVSAASTCDLFSLPHLPGKDMYGSATCGSDSVPILVTTAGKLRINYPSKAYYQNNVIAGEITYFTA